MRKRQFIILILLLVMQKSVALIPVLPPSSNFDLSAWKLQALDASLAIQEVFVPQLTSGYTSGFFYTNATDGSVVFKVPSNGEASTGPTGYPRIELRQMTGGANWKLTDASEHYLTAQCKVISVAQAKPQTIIGQIHGSEINSELLKIRWTGYLPGQCKIEARFELNDATQAEYGVILASGLSLGDMIDYTITMKSGTINCTVNGVSASQTYTSTYFGTTDAYYFKAGNYLQYNPLVVPDPTVIYGQNQFYKLSLTKLATDVQSNSMSNEFNIYPNPAKDKIRINCTPLNSDLSLQIYTWNGKLVKITKIENMTADISDLPNGMYLAKLNTQNGSKMSKLLVVR